MKKIILLSGLLVSALAVTSCGESYLDETPKDFMSTSNSFITENDFECSSNNLYNQLRNEFYSYDENRPFDYIYSTDLVYDGEPYGTQRHSNMTGAFTPTSDMAKKHWQFLYGIISSANTIITRLPASTVSQEKQLIFEAEARFFRGMAYRTLAYLYGGVPIILEEIETPRWDFNRASYDETLAQAISDVEYAAQNLPAINKVSDGKVNSAAAYHLLSELYLAKKDYQKAISAATTVIDDPNTGLMYNRFGSRQSEPGDVYWDLFRQNNQNRGSGNTEGLFVIQIENLIPGGSGSLVAKEGTYCLERHIGPMFRDVKTADGIKPFVWPVSDYTCGRGIGWGISTTYFYDDIWQDDFNGDIRNSNYNFVRRVAVHNAAYKAVYGDTLDMMNPPAGVKVPCRQIYPYQSKCTTPYNHPEGLYTDKAAGKLGSGAGGTYTDQYMFRLAETYLLRAEAYMLAGDKQKAADDINVIRGRAHAKPVEASKVDMNYILDERMRELGIEEKRRLTLVRTGMLYERVVKCNPFYADQMQKHYALFPIPYTEIEANQAGTIEQNPGY